MVTARLIMKVSLFEIREALKIEQIIVDPSLTPSLYLNLRKKAIVLNLSRRLSESSLSDSVLPMVTMSDNPTSSAIPFEQFTDNNGTDYDKRLCIIGTIKVGLSLKKSYLAPRTLLTKAV